MTSLLRTYVPSLHPNLKQIPNLSFFSTREATVLPLSSPLRTLSNKMITQIPIPKGTTIIVGIMGSNHNPKIWGDDSYEWKPERWLKPPRDEVVKAKIPGVYSNL